MSHEPRPAPAPSRAGEQPEEKKKVNAASVVGSILAAAFGVQSSRSRERDFAAGNYRHYIIGGIVFTVLFVLTLVMVVRLVLGSD